MSSARIDLSSGGACSAGIDRTKPAILEPFMQDSEWNQFCNDIDGALRAVNTANQLSMGFFGLTFVTFVIVMIVGFASAASSFGEFPDSGSSGPSVGVLFLLPAVMVVVGMVFMCFSGYRASEAVQEIQQICKETSNRQPRLSFHVRYERSYYRSHSGVGHDHHHGHNHGQVHSHTTQYIEVSINQNTVTIPIGTSSPDDIGAHLGGSRTAAERLEELEKAKHLLSHEEYEKKRADIIAGV